MFNIFNLFIFPSWSFLSRDNGILLEICFFQQQKK